MNRFLFGLIFLVLNYSATNALANVSVSSNWSADKATGCNAWNQNPQANESVTWSGACVDGKASGKGVVTLLQNDSIIETTSCSFKEGKCEGKGTRVFKSGNRYEGDFVDGIRTGKGILYFADGGQYKGDFLDGKFQGKGRFIWANGNRYQGEFLDGKGKGVGVYTLADGSSVEGTFDDARTGRLNKPARTQSETTSGDEAPVPVDKAHESCAWFESLKTDGNDTITDPQTGLMWKRCSEGQDWTGSDCRGNLEKYDWVGAMAIAKQSSFNGQRDWRLPSREELDSLLTNARNCSSRDIFYSSAWAYSPDGSDEWKAWGFGNWDLGKSKGFYRFEDGLNVRLVRTPQSGVVTGTGFEQEYANIPRYQADFLVRTVPEINEGLFVNWMVGLWGRNYEPNTKYDLFIGEKYKTAYQKSEILHWFSVGLLFLAIPWSMLRRNLLVFRIIPYAKTARLVQIALLVSLASVLIGISAFNPWNEQDSLGFYLGLGFVLTTVGVSFYSIFIGVIWWLMRRRERKTVPV